MGKKFRFIVNLDRPRGYEAFAVQKEDQMNNPNGFPDYLKGEI